MSWIAVGSIWGFLGVALGAFGAHALDLSPEAEGWWETATLYHLVHALFVVLAGVLAESRTGRAVTLAPASGLVGSIVFSGTLYAMALGAPRFLGAITPLGGVGMLVGWLSLAFAARGGAQD